jgi:uncharacterized membrane protein YeaQ/YmgE (transglycosylase-associated protein family)
VLATTLGIIGAIVASYIEQSLGGKRAVIVLYGRGLCLKMGVKVSFLTRTT